MGGNYPNLSMQTKFVSWIDEKISWRTYCIMNWYCQQYYLSKCTTIGKNLRLGQPARKPVITGGGKIHFGDNVTIMGKLELTANSTNFANCTISIGNNTMIGEESVITARKSVTIGNDCLIARYVYISDTNGHPMNPAIRRTPNVPDNEINEVVIGNNVWIGHFANIHSGVTIGDNSIIASNAVVTKDVPSNTIAMGYPARVCGWLDKMYPNLNEVSQ